MFLPSNITLQFGDSGDFVAELQRRLAAVKAHSPDGISGMYDGATVNSVTSFQGRVGLRADGVAGPETLRRLNGIISGDTSSGSDDKKEEEAAKQQAQETLLRMEMMAAQSPIIEPLQERREAHTEERQAESQPDHGARMTPEQGMAAAASAPLTAEQIQQQLMRDQQMQRDQRGMPPEPSPNPGDLLAQMLLQQTQNAAQQPQLTEPKQGHQAPGQHPPVRPQYAPTPAPHTTVPPSPGQHAPHQPQPALPGGVPQEVAAGVPAPEQGQSKGIIGRALQKMDALVQKLAEYFEAKLPPDVLREVKQAGQTMLQSGVKEIPIPTGPEQVRGPVAPSRGPDQQPQIPQRG